MVVPIKKRILRHGARNRPSTRRNSGIYGHVNKNLYICWHETDNYSRTAGAAAHAAWLYNNPEMLVGYHYSVDHLKIYKHIPISEGAWHAGDGVNGRGNLNSIGMEICVNKVNYNWDLYMKAIDNGAWLSAKLIKENGSGTLVFPDGVKQHFDFSGKNCPRLIRRDNRWGYVIERINYYLTEKGEEEEDESMGYRVAVGSNRTYEESEKILKVAQREFPTHEPFIVLNEVNGEEWFRVILRETERRDQAEAVQEAARNKGVFDSVWIVTDWEDLEYEMPEPEPPEDDDPDEDEDKYSIMSPQTAMKKQAKQWAIDKGAHARFIEGIPLYWKYGSKTGINPVLLYAQSGLETGFGHYQGAVPPEYNNWAGIKTEDATGDEPEDHEQFETREDGVRAHFNHMCAYIGQEPIGEPHARYFLVKTISWAGSIRYAEELSGRWAPSEDYGERVINLAHEIEESDEYEEEEEEENGNGEEENGNDDERSLIIDFLKSLIKAIVELIKKLGGR